MHLTFARPHNSVIKSSRRMRQTWITTSYSDLKSGCDSTSLKGVVSTRALCKGEHVHAAPPSQHLQSAVVCSGLIETGGMLLSPKKRRRSLRRIRLNPVSQPR